MTESNIDALNKKLDEAIKEIKILSARIKNTETALILSTGILSDALNNDRLKEDLDGTMNDYCESCTSLGRKNTVNFEYIETVEADQLIKEMGEKK